MLGFRKTIGHEKQKQLFLRAAEASRLAHAYALTGPEHVGKTTFARELAEILGANSVLDVFVFDDEGEAFSIEEARNLQRNLSLTGTRGQYRVGIIAYAERMTREASNSLLKFLEEPPRSAMIFLVTANLYALLPTIRSRLQRINFACGPVSEVRRAISRFDLTEEQITAIVESVRGRIGLAITLATAPELVEFYTRAKQYYQILVRGDLLRRLQAAEALASLGTAELKSCLQFFKQKWVEDGPDSKLAAKLQTAHQDIKSNLNLRLLLDNLFLT